MPLWTLLLASLMTPCIHGPPSSSCIATIDLVGKESESLQVPHLMESKYVVSFMLSKASLCTLFGSTLWAHHSTLSLVVSLMSSNADTSLKISFIMPQSSNPCIHCSVSSLGHIVYSHMLLPLPAANPSILGKIHGFFLFSVWCCSNSTFLLQYGLNLWLSIEKSPFAVLYSSFSSFVNVFIL